MIEFSKVKEVDPKDLVIYAQPKLGKTTICADLTKKLEGKAVIFGLEKGGTDYLEGYFLNCYKNSSDGYTEAIANYKAGKKWIRENRDKIDYLIVDNLSILDDWADIAGTYYYMSTTQGKNFNRDNKTNIQFTHTHPEWKSVTTLGDGMGWRYPRDWFMSEIEDIMSLVNYRIWIVHVKDKFIKDTVLNETIVGAEMALTGKLKSMLASRVSTICKLVSDKDKRYLSFDNENESLIAGSRAPSLTGRILISDKKDGEIITYWENIYKNLSKTQEK